MASARDIKRKIASVQSTQKITKAMKMVSAAKMRRSLEAMMAARPYADKLTAVVSNLASRSTGDVHPFFQAKDEVKTLGVLIVTSDKGLCGAFNSNVIKSVANFCAEHADKEIKFYMVGKRAFDFFRRRQAEILENFATNGGKYSYQSAETIGKVAVSAFENGDIDELHVFYNMYKSTSSQVVTHKKLLPVVVEIEQEEMFPDFIYEPNMAMILDVLLPKFVNVNIFQSMLESSAGEHGARMVAMDNATRSAGEMIKKLVLNYNKARQGAITRELLDIVNGAEALN